MFCHCVLNPSQMQLILCVHFHLPQSGEVALLFSVFHLAFPQLTQMRCQEEQSHCMWPWSSSQMSWL